MASTSTRAVLAVGPRVSHGERSALQAMLEVESFISITIRSHDIYYTFPNHFI